METGAFGFSQLDFILDGSHVWILPHRKIIPKYDCLLIFLQIYLEPVLEALQPGAFSACTFHVKGRPIIVYSPLASYGRTLSDLAHEISHILVGHGVQTVQQLDGVSFFTCDPDEEQEANWLAGCLLLPRMLMLQAVRRELSAEHIAREYGVSISMAEFRIRATGVLRQLQVARRSSSRSLAGNPDSPQGGVFLTASIDEIVGVATYYMHYHAI